METTISSIDSPSILRTGKTSTDIVSDGPNFLSFQAPDIRDNSSGIPSSNIAPVNKAIAAYNPYEDDEEEYIRTIGLEDLGNDAFDVLPNSTPNFYKSKGKGTPMFPIDKDGIVDGKYFGQPGTFFQKVENYTGEVGIMFFDEVFPEELEEIKKSSFLGLGKKAKARREEKRAARTEKKEARKARKQARVDRKNKRVEIRSYKAETKRIKTENNEPSAFDKILNVGKDLIESNNQLMQDDPLFNENGEEGDFSENARIGNSQIPSIRNFDVAPRKASFLTSPIGIVLILGLIGGAIYMLKNRK